MFERHITEQLTKYLAQYPVVTITGPRQSGKTTLCKKFKNRPYVSLEDPHQRERALKDPLQFLKDYKGGTIDEFQKVPLLTSYIQGLVDDWNEEGVYILTGSQQFEAMSQVSQSLAGRTALLKLLPFSCGEIKNEFQTEKLATSIWRGFYPRIYDKNLNPYEAMSFYFQTYIERDVRALINIKNLNQFERFVRLCAGRTGQLLNLQNLAGEVGVSYHTINEWISVLEASYIIYRLQPHYKNYGKRLTKTTKLYFWDTGLCCFLLGIQSPEQLQLHPFYGSLFETFVISELYKQQYNKGKLPSFYYWRTSSNEIDLLMDFGSTLFPLEIKSGTTIASDFFKGLNFYLSQDPQLTKGALVYGGRDSYTQNNIRIISYLDITMLSDLDYQLKI